MNKRLMALALAAVMTASTSVTAFATVKVNATPKTTTSTPTAPAPYKVEMKDGKLMLSKGTVSFLPYTLSTSTGKNGITIKVANGQTRLSFTDSTGKTRLVEVGAEKNLEIKGQIPSLTIDKSVKNVTVALAPAAAGEAKTTIANLQVNAPITVTVPANVVVTKTVVTDSSAKLDVAKGAEVKNVTAPSSVVTGTGASNVTVTNPSTGGTTTGGGGSTGGSGGGGIHTPSAVEKTMKIASFTQTSPDAAPVKTENGFYMMDANAAREYNILCEVEGIPDGDHSILAIMEVDGRIVSQERVGITVFQGKFVAPFEHAQDSFPQGSTLILGMKYDEAELVIPCFMYNAVKGITVAGAGSATTISTNYGTLQMETTFDPVTPTFDEVVWSVNDTSLATIDQDGLLTAKADGTVTVTATSVSNPSVKGTADIVISAQTQFAVTATNNGQNVQAGTAITNMTLTPANGTSTISYAITKGTLPTGLTLSNGVISGTVAATVAPGVYSVTVKATDSDTPAKTATVEVSVVVRADAILASVTNNSQTVAQGVAITNMTLSTTGESGSVSYKLTNGALPKGISLNGTTIGGTVAADATVGSHVASITATDSTGKKSVVNVVIKVTAPLAVNAPATLTLTKDAAMTSVTVSATGGTAPYTYAVTPSLPAGLTLNGTTGVISGTPTATQASANYTVTVTDANSETATKAIAIVVNAAATPAMTVTATNATQTVTVNNAITSIALSTTNHSGAVTYAVTTGTLPTGVTLSGSTISGTPTATGTFNVVVTATDSTAVTAQTATVNITLTVNAVITNNCAACGDTNTSDNGGVHQPTPATDSHGCTIACNGANGGTTGTLSYTPAANTCTLCTPTCDGSAVTHATCSDTTNSPCQTCDYTGVAGAHTCTGVASTPSTPACTTCGDTDTSDGHTPSPATDSHGCTIACDGATSATSGTLTYTPDAAACTLCTPTCNGTTLTHANCAGTVTWSCVGGFSGCTPTDGVTHAAGTCAGAITATAWSCTSGCTPTGDNAHAGDCSDSANGVITATAWSCDGGCTTPTNGTTHGSVTAADCGGTITGVCDTCDKTGITAATHVCTGTAA